MTPTRGPVRGASASGALRAPDAEGVVVRDGVRVAWWRHGTAGPHVVLMPTWAIVPAQSWKGQVPFLSRHHRVTVVEGRGCGRSDRPTDPAAYRDGQYVADALAVLDDAGVDRAVLVGLSRGADWALRVAAARPDRVDGVVAIGPACRFAGRPPSTAPAFDALLDEHEGWGTWNRHHWLAAGGAGYEEFLRFFFATALPEPHSTKQLEDALAWGRDVGPAVLAATVEGRLGGAEATIDAVCAAVRCPVHVLHGTDDRVQPPAVGERLAELTGASLLLVEGGGHLLPAREPVLVNREVRAFVERVTGYRAPPSRRTWRRALSRERRALFLSSPIGLGHARRDVAIADALRALRPGLEVDWLTQDPVVRLLEGRGERVHPASAALASESAHVEDECADHHLHAFRAIRSMDAVLVHNAMVFDDVVREERYDLVVADEAWDVDRFLHENPELKRSALVWLTDFVGWMPMPAGGAEEAALTADHNAEMLEHRARFPGLRDLSLFVGEPDDVVTDPLGPGLPGVREWTVGEFAFPGYVAGSPTVPPDERAALREGLGYRDGEPVCLVAVGGSAVGLPLLRRIADAVPALRRALPDLRVVMVTGPRIDPRAVPARPGLELHGWVPDLDRRLAACDVAIVQGGLTTCMELAANRRPFVYVPLRDHFEQNVHVRHRLERHRAGRCLDYARAADPDALVEAVAAALRTPTDPLPVPADGAARAAALIAELL